MSVVLRVGEHELVEVGPAGLAEHELEYLIALRDRGVRFFSEERIRGRWCCRFGGYVGAVLLPGGRTLEVLPKIAGLDDQGGRGLLMRMLSVADLAPALEDAPADYAGSSTLIEAYLRFAADLAVRQVRVGLVHAYRRLDQRLPVVRGRLLVARQLARLPERFDAHLVRADEFVADTPVNRVIKAGVRWIARCSRSDATVAKCREAVMRMEAVADIPAEPRVLADAVRPWRSGAALDRQYMRLAPLLKLLGLLVGGRAAAPEAGVEALGPTLLFDMSELFEAVLAARLRAVAPDVIVRAQGTHAFDVGRRFRLRPDLVVEQVGRPVMVLDAKWKRISGLSDIDDHDLRQAFAYARILGLDDAALVYPAMGGDTALSHSAEVADGSGVRIHLRQVALAADGWTHTDHALRGLLDERRGRSWFASHAAVC